MGFWKTERGIGGDAWADEMGRCMKALSAMVVTGSKTYGDERHEITLAEFADLIEFCSRGQLVVNTAGDFPDDHPIAELFDDEVKTIANRGQIHCHDTCPI